MTQLDYDYEGELDLDVLLALALKPVDGKDVAAVATATPTLIRRLKKAEKQVSEARRVVAELKKSKGSFHGPVVDEVRHADGAWVESALDGLLDPNDARRSIPREWADNDVVNYER